MPAWLVSIGLKFMGIDWKGLVKKWWKPIILILALLGAYMYGFSKGDDRADRRIAAYEQQIKNKASKVEQGQVKIETKVLTRYRTKVERIYVERDANKGLIENNVKSLGQLPAGWVYVHNLAATGGLGEQKKAADATPSGVTTNDALAKVTANYAACRAELERFDALQTWVTDSQANVQASNKKEKGK